MINKYFLILVIIILGFSACETNVENPTPDPINNPEYANWLIPKSQIILRTASEDIIPAIDYPTFINADKTPFLSDDDLILGIDVEGEFRAYPISIMNYHEVVNDNFPNADVLISFSPLSGTSAAWNRGDMNGFSSNFRVSKYIYNSNHILFDHKTSSHWLPMYHKCVNGQLEGFNTESYAIVETTWQNWKDMFPDTKVMSILTGFNYNYTTDPYQNYKLSDSIEFYTQPLDSRLSIKEKVHGIIVNNRAKIYRYSSFAKKNTVLLDNFQGLSVVVAGNYDKKFIVSFERRITAGIELDFSAINNYPDIIMRDNEGNKYNIFGLAVEGPDKGRQLKPASSIMGYWFALAAMFPDPIIYE